MSYFCLSSVVVVWGAGHSAAGAVQQRVLERGEYTVRQMLRWPAQFLGEYWPFIAGGVVLLLLLRAYLRK